MFDVRVCVHMFAVQFSDYLITRESSDCKDQSSTKQHQPQSGPPPPLLGSQKLGAESRRVRARLSPRNNLTVITYHTIKLTTDLKV